MAERKVGPWQRFVNWLDARRFAYGLAAIAVLAFVVGYCTRIDVLNWIEPVDQLIEDFYANVTTDLLSIALTVLVIDAFNQRRETQRLKAQLIREMGSPDNGVALRAVEELRVCGWLENGALRGACLSQANLEGANLDEADLSAASLERANLRGARLWRANLRGAILERSDLQGATMGAATLQEAQLWRANLQGAFLERANLRGTSLWRANLQGAFLEGANLQGARLWRANLQEARLSGGQLAQADALLGATMFGGSRYTGFLSLPGDIESARVYDVDTEDPEAMADFYEVSLEAYLEGQEWMRSSLEEVRAGSEAWYEEHWSGDRYEA
jgi:uncharacterized protein YjbI with pentapeptide repeats